MKFRHQPAFSFIRPVNRKKQLLDISALIITKMSYSIITVLGIFGMMLAWSKASSTLMVVFISCLIIACYVMLWAYERQYNSHQHDKEEDGR